MENIEIKKIIKNMDLNAKAKEFAITKFLREYHYDMLLKEPETYLKDFRNKDELCKYAVKRTGQRWKYFMVTINFKPDVDFTICNKYVLKSLTKKWIKYFKYCWEWRDIDKGMHIHMKVEPDENKKIYDCKRELYNTFKHVVGNNMHINMRYSNKTNCFDEYIEGLKNGERKKCMDVTEIMRKKYDLQKLYI